MSATTEEMYTPAVESFIPILYVAWADGLLSPSEVKIIKEKIDKAELSKEEKQQIHAWINPGNWPSEQTFKRWVDKMQTAAGNSEIASIVDLGMKMVKRGKVDSKSGQLNQEKIRMALQELKEDLNISNLHKFRNLFKVSSDVEPLSNDIKDGLRIQKILDGTVVDLKKRLKILLSDPEFQYKIIRDKEVYRSKIMQWVQILADHGFGALGYAQKYGGQNDSMLYASVFEVLATHDLSLTIKFGVQFGLFGGAIHNLGTKKHHDLYLHDVGTLKLPGCFAMTETGHGSNVRDIETTATYLDDTKELLIHSPSFASGKEYIGNALHGKMGVVFAQLIVSGKNQGVHAVLVSMRDDQHQLLPGIKVEDCGYKMGLNGIDNGRIWFDQVKIPKENLLNRFGDIDESGTYVSKIKNPSKRFFTMLGTLVGGRICVAKAGLSAAKSALTIAVKYALKRRQFGPKEGELETLLLDYPSHQHRLMIPLATSYAAHFALDDLIFMYRDRDEENLREIETKAAGLKAWITDFTTRTIQECREACGGKGYLWENRFADLKADSDIFTTFEGDNTVLMQLVAKGMLSSYREEFHDEGIRSVIKYLSEQISSSITTLNPVYKRKTDADHLLGQGFHHHAFAFREREILVSLGSRMRTMFRKRINPYDAFLRSQNHMLVLAKAYVENLVLKSFYHRINDLNDGTIKDTFINMAQLYALSTIEKHKGWYLEKGYLESVKTKAIRRQVERLCGGLRVQANVLVNGFGIPNGLLDAPIAFTYPV